MCPMETGDTAPPRKVASPTRGAKKSRPILAEDVAAVFNDARVAQLAKAAKPPPGINIAVLAEGVREAARIFVRDASDPTANELHDQIAALLKASERRRYDDLALLLEGLSPQTRDLMPGLPHPGALHDVEQREAACVSIAASCQFGGQFVQGRRRPSGNRSRPVWRPYLYAPDRRRHFPKREAERNFVTLLSIAWFDATGVAPSRTAHHKAAGRDVGPFAKFLRQCLHLVGAGHADVVELLNELHRRRRMQRRMGEGSEGL
jgi:hypothetical protein